MMMLIIMIMLAAVAGERDDRERSGSDEVEPCRVVSTVLNTLSCLFVHLTVAYVWNSAAWFGRHRFSSIFGASTYLVSYRLGHWTCDSGGHRFNSRPRSFMQQPCASCSQACSSVIKQYNLVPAKGRWCPVAGKVTVGLASHWPCATDFSGLSTYDGLTA